MIAAAETKKRKPAKEADLSCIYGADVCKLCSVRQTLHKEKDPFKKNMISKLPIPGMEDMMDSLAETFDSKTHALAAFCAECPHLNIYKAKTEREFYDQCRKHRRSK